MPKEKPIHKMIDEVFHKDLNKDLFDEIVEERNFVVNTLKQFIETDEIWEQMVHNKGAASQNYYRHPDSLGTPNYVPPTNTGTGIASNPNAQKVGGYYNPRSRYQENHHPSGDARVRTFRVPIPYDPVSGASGKPHLRLNQPVFDRNEA
jgi:hypothetical protein